jgi:hypothetical protein
MLTRRKESKVIRNYWNVSQNMGQKPKCNSCKYGPEEKSNGDKKNLRKNKCRR